MLFRNFILLLAGTLGVRAGAATLGVEDASRLALQKNPSLAAARLRIEEARGRLKQSGRLSNPELEFEFSRNTMGREGELGVSLMQRFPLTARLRHEKAATQAQLAAAEAEVRDFERKLVAEVQTLAVKLLAIRNQRELRDQQLSNSRDLGTFLQKRVEVGEASAIDQTQVELEARQIETQQLQLGVEEAALTGELRPLIGMESDEAIVIRGELGRNGPPKGNDIAVVNRPDLQAAQHTAEAARAELAKERASRLEDVGLGAMWTRERTKDEPEPTETEQIVGFKISVPLPLWNRNDGRISEAAAAAERAQREADALAIHARGEVRAARGEMAALANLIGELDAKLLPKAAEIEERLRQLYGTGQTPLLEVLRARTRRLELQQQRLDALRDYQLARIRYTAATGRNH